MAPDPGDGVTDGAVPAEVQRLVDTFVASMDHVDVLLHLHAAPSRPVTVKDLVVAGHVDPTGVVRALRDFVAAGVVADAGGVFHYSPSARDANAVAALLEMYRTRPVTLIRAVYARPTFDKSYAEVFRTRRPENHEP
ncbi:MAG: MarR family transcriptional regulator [bacterium]